MKKYDFEKARLIIESRKEEIKVASLGMYEDWFWTAETVFEDGNLKHEMSGEIGGITGSNWATPTLMLELKDGTEECIPCYQGESTSNQPPYPNLGVLSGPAQDNMPPLSFKELD